MHFTYILLLKNKKLYTGTTGHLKTRYQEHKQGKVRSTNKLLPQLIHYEVYKLKSDAIRREKFLKTTEGKRLLKQQIRDVLKVNEVI